LGRWKTSKQALRWGNQSLKTARAHTLHQATTWGGVERTDLATSNSQGSIGLKDRGREPNAAKKTKRGGGGGNKSSAKKGRGVKI